MRHYAERDDYDNDEANNVDWEDDPPFWHSIIPIIAAFLIGAIVGLLAGNQFFSSGAAGSVTSETCLVLASELYRQGESLDVVQEHLAALGYYNPGPVLLKMADEYEASDEPQKQRQSEDLRALGQALVAAAIGPAATRQPTTIANPTPTLAAVAAAPTAKTAPSPTATPAAQPARPTATPAPPRATATPAPPRSPQPTPTTKPAATPTAQTAQDGIPARITSSGGEGAILRRQPTTSSDALAALPHGTRVSVLQIVNGEAIDPVEPRWYQIRYGNLVGYVYYKLIVLGQ